jgi:hypothetical protein
MKFEKPGLKKILNSLKYKNNKFIYYVKNITRYLTPKFILRQKLPYIIARLPRYDEEYINDRVNYYNKLNSIQLGDNAICLKDFKFRKNLTAYFFDTYQYTRYFPDSLKIAYHFGDVITVPESPSIVKSRPVIANNNNSVLLNLDKARHFVFIKDKQKFEDKKNKLIGRGAVSQQHRIKFWEMYFNHPMCDLGQTNESDVEARKIWTKKFTGIRQHLDFKFILCLEGYDVATNLKWVMSSNSLAVMPAPAYETWFMEGRLIANYHYVEIRPDYSDLEERLNYYIKHTGEALQIIQNAHAYISQFQDKKREDLISLMVLQKYFENTRQLCGISLV